MAKEQKSNNKSSGGPHDRKQKRVFDISAHIVESVSPIVADPLGKLPEGTMFYRVSAEAIADPEEARQLVKRNVENMKWRMDFGRRLDVHLMDCWRVLLPYLDQKFHDEKYMEPREIMNVIPEIVEVINLIRRDLPGQVFWAVEALDLIIEVCNQYVNLTLQGENTVPRGTPADKTLRYALCLAIELGQCLAIIDTERVHGESIHQGQKIVEGRVAGSQTTSRKATEREMMAKAEFDLRMSFESKPKGMKTQTLRNMSEAKNPDGTPLYGSFETLRSYSKKWEKGNG